jgi:hypothetical protein
MSTGRPSVVVCRCTASPRLDCYSKALSATTRARLSRLKAPVVPQVRIQLHNSRAADALVGVVAARDFQLAAQKLGLVTGRQCSGRCTRRGRANDSCFREDDTAVFVTKLAPPTKHT